MSDRLSEIRDFVTSVDPDLQRVFPFEVEEVRDSGSGKGVYTVRGHAAVFNKWSLDLGGFREKIEPGAFDNALSADPHVLHLWDHDTAKALSSTRSKDYPLELRSDPAGLRFYSKVAPTSYSEDLRTLLEGGVIDQSSFAFTVAKDEWRITDEGDEELVERTILEVKDLYDVTTCAMGAYPTTDSALAVRSLSLGRSRTRAVVVAPHDTNWSFTDCTVSGNQAGDSKEAAPNEEGTPQASDEDARKREFEQWRQKRMAEYRRTREFAFGVNNKERNDV